MQSQDFERELESLRSTLSQCIVKANELHEAALKLISSPEALASLRKKGIGRSELMDLTRELNGVVSDLRSARNKYLLLGAEILLLLKQIGE